MRIYNIKTALTVSFAALILFCGESSFAGSAYDEMRNGFDKRSNVSYVKDGLRITKSDREHAGDDVTDTLNEITKLQEEWLESIGAEEPAEFYTIDNELKAKVEAAYEDDETIRALLTNEVSLDLLTALLIYKNPAILSAENSIDAAVTRFSQVANLDLIMRDYVSFTQSLGDKIGPKKNLRMVSMEFPFPGMLSLKGEIVKKDVRIARLKYDNVKIKMITKLRKAYYNLLYIIKEEEITKKTFGLLGELEQVANIKYETGRTSFNDVIKVQIKRERLKDMLATIADKKVNVKVMIAKFIDMPADTVFGKVKETHPAFNRPLQELYEAGLENNREIMILEEKLKRMALMIEMAEKKFYPDFTMGYSYFDDNKVKKVGSQAMMAPFMMKPMDSEAKDSGYARNDAYIQEVKEKYKAMEDMLKAKRNELTIKIKDTNFHIDKATREEALYRDNLIKKADEALKVANTGYETGSVSFLNALDADMTWLKFNIEYFKAIKHKAVSISEMEAAVAISK
jgi:outer membrane protein TolC